MGWAKYCEDNLEIMVERQCEKGDWGKEVTIIYQTDAPNSCIQMRVIEAPTMKRPVQFEDKYIVCKDCGKKFLFSAKEQKRFAEKRWTQPKRCKCCRDYRNALHLMCASF